MHCCQVIEEAVPPEYLPDGLLSPYFWFEIRPSEKDLSRLAKAMEKDGGTICTLQDARGRMLAFSRIQDDVITEFYIHAGTRDASLRVLCRCSVRFIEHCHRGEDFHEELDHKVSYAA